MQTPDNTSRQYLSDKYHWLVAQKIDPAKPHSFSPHLRWRKLEDGTFVLEMSCIDWDAFAEPDRAPVKWQEVALWQDPPASVKKERVETFLEKAEAAFPPKLDPKDLHIGRFVRTSDIPSGPQDWHNPGHRRYGVEGTITGKSDAHGLCWHVQYADGRHGWFNPEELTGIEKLL